MLNPFTDIPNVWDMAVLTDGINRVPVLDQWITRDFNWNEEGISIPFFMFDQTEGYVKVIDPKAWGGVPDELYLQDGAPVGLTIPHYPAHSVLAASEITARREANTEAILESIEARKAKHYELHQNSQQLTIAVNRMAALRGLVLRKDGRVYMNLARKLGRKIHEFRRDFLNPAFDWRAFFQELKPSTEDRVMGTPMTGIDVLMPDAFFTALVNSTQYKEFWKDIQSNLLMRDLRGGHEFYQGIFVRNIANFKIPETDRYAFPLDEFICLPRITGLLQTKRAPRQNFEFQHTEGVEMYLEGIVNDRKDKMDFYSEHNGLNFLRQYEVVSRGKVGAKADEAALNAPYTADELEGA